MIFHNADIVCHQHNVDHHDTDSDADADAEADVQSLPFSINSCKKLWKTGGLGDVFGWVFQESDRIHFNLYFNQFTFNDNTVSRRFTYQWQRPNFSKPWWEYKRGAASVTITVIINHYILQGIGNGGNAGTEAASEMMLSQPFIPIPKLSIFALFFIFITIILFYFRCWGYRELESKSSLTHFYT